MFHVLCFMFHDMKVAILTPVFPPYGGGMGMVAYHHARLLAARGVDVTVVTPEYHRLRSEVKDFNILYVPAVVRLGNAAVLRRVERLFAGFDVLALHHPFVGAAKNIFHRPAGPRLVVHYHMDLIAPGWRGAVLRTWQARVLPQLLAAADHVTVLSYDYARHGILTPWVQRYQSKFSELPNGVDTGQFFPGPKNSPLIERLRLAGKRVAVFVGGMDSAHYFKGVDVLLAALRELPADVAAVLVGSGNLQGHYQALAETLGVASRTRFVGSVPPGQLADYYRIADVVVLPSVTRSEAFGVVLLEAMACGKPTVASALPGVRTVVRDGVTGLLCHPGRTQDLAEKISILLGNPQLAEAYGQAGHQMASQHYAWPGIGDRLSNLYQRVVTTAS